MPRRTEIFSSTNIDSLVLNNPYLLLYQKTDWPDYLELLAKIYDLLEEEGKPVEWARVEALIEAFYGPKNLASPATKKLQFTSMAISELGLLQDSHDAYGNRYIEPTRSGKQFLKQTEDQIFNRRKFTGAGVEHMLGSLNQLLYSQEMLTVEEAVAELNEKIRSYKEDIKRVQTQGVQAAQLLSRGYSSEELLVEANEAAARILAASEDIKLAVERARKQLIKRYHQEKMSVGQAIEYVADFHAELRKTPEYVSYMKAKDLLSHIEGLQGLFKHTDVSRIVRMLEDRQVIQSEVLKQTVLPVFSYQFQRLCRSIEEKVQQQIHLLRVQVHYVMASDSQRTRNFLQDLLSQFYQAPEQVEVFLKQSSIEIELFSDFDLGSIELNSFEQIEHLNQQVVALNTFDGFEWRQMVESLRLAEEATIQKVLAKLKAEIRCKERVVLSEYSIEYGLIEYYVLDQIEMFDSGIQSIEGKKMDFIVDLMGGRLVLRDMNDREFFISH